MQLDYIKNIFQGFIEFHGDRRYGDDPAIVGGIAEAYYGIPADIRSHALTFLDDTLFNILTDFENKYPSKVEIGTKHI